MQARIYYTGFVADLGNTVLKCIYLLWMFTWALYSDQGEFMLLLGDRKWMAFIGSTRGGSHLASVTLVGDDYFDIFCKEQF